MPLVIICVVSLEGRKEKEKINKNVKEKHEDKPNYFIYMIASMTT